MIAMCLAVPVRSRTSSRSPKIRVGTIGTARSLPPPLMITFAKDSVLRWNSANDIIRTGCPGSTRDNARLIPVKIYKMILSNLRKGPRGSASSTRCGKSRSFLRPMISRLRRVICTSMIGRSGEMTLCLKQLLLVGAGEQRRRNVEAKYLGALQVDDKLELTRSKDRQVGGLFTFENPTRVDAELAFPICKARPVAH